MGGARGWALAVRFAVIVFDRANPGRRSAARAIGAVRADRRLRAAGLVAIALAMIALAWVDPGSLCALPVFVLALLFTLGRYPGEHALAAFARTGGERRTRPAMRVPRPARPGLIAPRGGLLLACALAERPPPVASPAAA